MQTLQRVSKGRSVPVLTHMSANLDTVIRSSSEEVRIERAMVDRTHRDTVRNNRFATIPVRFDVRGVKESRAGRKLRSAERSLYAISTCAQKHRLVEAIPCDSLRCFLSPRE